MAAASLNATSWLDPVADLPTVYYRQYLSWDITDKVVNEETGDFCLKLGTGIPGAKNSRMGTGFFKVTTGPKHAGIKWKFFTLWPKEVKRENIVIDIRVTQRRNGDEVGSVVRNNEFLGAYHKTFYVIGSSDFFVDKSVLKNGDIRSFFFNADISIINKVATEDPSDTIGYLPAPSDFVEEIKKIYSNEETSDVEVVCDGKVFKCHRNILSARSVTFKNMLAHHTAEHATRQINIKESSAEAVEIMLKYIYNGDTPDVSRVLDQVLLDLLQLADMYNLTRMKIVCGEDLFKKLEVSNCITTYITVNRHFHSTESRFRVMLDLFMRCRAEQVVESEDWAKFVKKFPEIATDVMKSIAKGVKEVHRCIFCI